MIMKTAIQLIFLLILTSLPVSAQDRKYAAREILSLSISAANEAFPLESEWCTIEGVELDGDYCLYHAVVKDRSTFNAYRSDPSVITRNLALSFKNNIQASLSMLVLGIDSGTGLRYEYYSPDRNDYFTVTLTTEDFSSMLDGHVTDAMREEIAFRSFNELKDMLGYSFTGSEDDRLKFECLMEDNGDWDTYDIDEYFIDGMTTAYLRNDNEARIFPLYCLYLEKGEELTGVNRETGQTKTGFIPYGQLREVFATYRDVSMISDRREDYGLTDDDYDGQGIRTMLSDTARIPFELVTPPKFRGGDANKFAEWVNSQLMYPENAKENGIQGRVTLSFTVTKKGDVQDVKILHGVTPSLDAEALRVVRKSPRWKPGEKDGQKVDVTYTFPVIFQLR